MNNTIKTHKGISLQTFINAINGIKTSLTEQFNFKIHTVFAILALSLTKVLALNLVEVLIITTMIFLVFIAEMFNSAIKSFEQDDLNHDYQEFLNEFNGEYNNKLKYLVRDIEDEYIPAIIKKLEYLEDRV